MHSLGSYLETVDFPATKDDLIDAALEADCPQDVIEQLQRLSNEQYDTRAEVERELAAPD